MSTLSDTVKAVGPARLGMMGAVLFGIILFFIFITARLSNTDLALLYSNLDSNDIGAIASKLEQVNIPYQLSTDGTSVSVADNDVGRARMILAEEGLPSSASVGYELFDEQSSFGTTDFVQNINQVRALEGEIGRTISTLKSVKTARIHLVLPKRQLFSRDAQPATASVFVKLRSGQDLGAEQISAIQHMVAAAVPQLKPARVSIVDENGKLLARGVDDSDNPEAFFGENAEDMQQAYERRMSRMVEDLITEIVGFGNVRANVSAELDFDRISSNSEIYDPEGQVVRSTQVIEENLEENDGNRNPGVTVGNNLPGLANAPAGQGGGASNSSNRVEEITNFEITKTIRNHIKETGQVTRLSVAVLLDGTYITDAEGVKTYQPRGEKEIEQIESLVRSAIGFDDARGDTIEVLNLKFAGGEDEPQDILADTTIMGFERADLLDIAETVTLAIVALLVVFLVLQPLVNKLIESATAATGSLDNELENLITSQLENQAALAAPDGGDAGDDMINMDKVEGRVKAAAVQKVNELVEKHPNETVSVIRNWMYQEN